jgi:hypothetical protein
MRASTHISGNYGSEDLVMGRSLKEVIAALPAERRERVEARAASLIAEEKTLQDLRQAMKKTQSAVARKLRIRQENVSRIETRADLLISTLEQYVGALGGKLRFVAEFPDRPPVRLRGIGTLARDEPARKTAKAAARR